MTDLKEQLTQAFASITVDDCHVTDGRIDVTVRVGNSVFAAGWEVDSQRYEPFRTLGAVTIAPDEFAHWAAAFEVTGERDAVEHELTRAIMQLWAETHRSGVATKAWARCLTATQMNGRWCVKDDFGAIWLPDYKATQQITGADDPAAEAVDICSRTPYRGDWNG